MTFPFRLAFAPFVLPLVAGATLAVSPETPDRILTLDDSVRVAQNNSDSVLAAREDVNIALQRVRQAESLFFPRLDLNANWSKFRVQGDRPFLLQPGLGLTPIINNPQENFYSARADIYQTVYQGGRVRNTWRQARISYERAKSASDALESQVTNTAKLAFYDLLFAQERSRVLSEALQHAEAVRRQAERGSALEWLRIESAMEQLRSQAAQAELGEQQARLAYLHALNLELSTRVQVKGELTTRPIELDLQKMLAWALQYRSELRQTEYQEELDALGISLSLAERTPTVAFGATYERSGFSLGVPTADWAGTLNVNLPVSISDMFYGWAKVREHRSQYRQATLKHEETVTQIQMQVRDAYIRYRFWQGELTPREDDVHRLADLVEHLQRAPGSDRVEGERLWAEARDRYAEAVHGHLVALADLEKAIGRSFSGEL